uniref:Uncharacterized protein n=1 Tax=Ascaris lumbricoides TaxID=6252 RepID=A0A0M3IHZ8_ASCLU
MAKNLQDILNSAILLRVPSFTFSINSSLSSLIVFIAICAIHIVST